MNASELSHLFSKYVSFKPERPPKRKPFGPPCKIKFNGQYISIGVNNKSVWKCRGHAKSALRDKICNSNFWTFLFNLYGLEHRYSSKDAAWNQFLSESQSAGILEFVELSSQNLSDFN